jgi:hypothetical protein
MVQRYSHLAPDHLRQAVERLVPGQAPVPSERTELRENFESRATNYAGVS